jgi:DNA-directed RNA polymerase subunit M/transcription elongation factor TFIIS
MGKYELKMIRITFDKKCPICKNKSTYRIHRHQLLRIVPGSRRYECEKCQIIFTIVLWRISFVKI